jgi:hypothetical protein
VLVSLSGGTAGGYLMLISRLRALLHSPAAVWTQPGRPPAGKHPGGKSRSMAHSAEMPGLIRFFRRHETALW